MTDDEDVILVLAPHVAAEWGLKDGDRHTVEGKVVRVVVSLFVPPHAAKVAMPPAVADALDAHAEVLAATAADPRAAESSAAGRHVALASAEQREAAP